MGFTLTTPPAAEPVSYAEAAAHLRLDTSNAQARPTAPTVALASPAEAGSVNVGAHRYRVTFVTSAGETDGGDISAIVTVADTATNGKVRVTNIQLGGAGVTSRKLYRTLAAGSAYFLVATIADNATTAYTDNIADGALGAGVPSANGTVDPQIAGFIAAARHHAERFTGCGIVNQAWTQTLDAFPEDGVAIPLPRGPVMSIDDITYVDANGDEQTIADDLVILDQSTLSASVSLVSGEAWPTVSVQKGAVRIEFTVGYGEDSTDVPADIKAAILLRIGDLYRNREAQQDTPLSANRTICDLLEPHVRTALA